jgi:hypothetical protein
VKEPNVARARATKLRRRSDGEEPGVMSPDKPDPGSGSDPAGRRYRTLCKPRDDKNRRSSLSSKGEGNTGRGKLADDRDRLRRGKGGSTQGWVVAKLAKPSWSRGERPGAR